MTLDERLTARLCRLAREPRALVISRCLVPESIRRTQEDLYGPIRFYAFVPTETVYPGRGHPDKVMIFREGTKEYERHARAAS